MKENLYTGISFLAGVLSVLLVIWLAPLPNQQAQGVFLSANKSHPPVDPAVVLQLPHPPFDAELVGHINIERRYSPTTMEEAKEEISALVRQYAAKAGANTVVVQLFDLGAVTSTHFIYVFRATAYYSPTVHSTVPIFSRLPKQ